MFRSKIGLTDYVPQRIDVTDLSDSMNALYRPSAVMTQMPPIGSNCMCRSDLPVEMTSSDCVLFAVALGGSSCWLVLTCPGCIGA